MLVPPHRRKRKQSGKPEDREIAEHGVSRRWGLSWAQIFPLACGALAILLVIVARVRLLGMPLERDEGEYAYIGDLMLQGVAPYGVAANMKLPGTNAAYALIMAVFGRSILGIHAGFLLV